VVPLDRAERTVTGPEAPAALRTHARGTEGEIMNESRAGVFRSPQETAEVAVLIVAHNSAGDLPGLLTSLRAEASAVALRVIVVDNASTDATLQMLAGHPDVVVVAGGGNLGYAGGVNAAAAHAGPAPYLLVLNPDLQVRPGAISTLLRAADENPDAGALSPRMVGDDGHTAVSLYNEPRIGRALGDAVLGRIWRTRPAPLTEWVRTPSSYMCARAVDWATGAALLIPRPVADAVGEWDERFFLYSEETDFCHRVRDLGRCVWFVPAAVVQHSQGGSGSSAQLDALMCVNRVRYMRKHHGRTVAGVYRGVVILNELLRSAGAAHRTAMRALVSERTWASLPHASTQGAT
jgi:GT2 family glycosyltransferase